MRTAARTPGRFTRVRSACCALLALLASSGEAAPPSAAQVRVADGVLHVDADGRPLGEVLGEVKRQTGIEMRLAADAAAQPVTAHFARPVDQGLGVLLANLPGSLIERDSAGRVTRVFVLAGAPDGAAAPLPEAPAPALEALVKTIPVTPMSAEDRAALVESAVSQRDRRLDPATRRAQAAARDRAVARVLDADRGADGLAEILGERLRAVTRPGAPTATEALTPPRSTPVQPR